MSDAVTECHPYDDACGGPGGRCRNHGGIGDLNAALAAAAQKVAVVEAERDFERARCARLAGIADDLENRIAEARREGAAEVEDRVAAFLPSWVPDLDPWFLRELRTALRGDA